MSKDFKIAADWDTWLELSNIADGTFAPLDGFMDRACYRGVVENMMLPDGAPWTIPITASVPAELAKKIGQGDTILFENDAREVIGTMNVRDVFQIDATRDIALTFGTDDNSHPGVAREKERSTWRVGGKTILEKNFPHPFPQFALPPNSTKKIFREQAWNTVVGFQTRNPPHRAHEYLQRTALEQVDGLFLQPLIGWKKKGDFTPDAVMQAYERQVKEFYPKNRVVLGCLMTPMRYAGPREAAFHAIIRRNHGCSHFIVGRDHAGVGGFYGKYDAQKLCLSLKQFGITIMPLCGPYYCKKCEGIVTEKTCGHGAEFVVEVSGTDVRRMLLSGQAPPHEYMRSEISEVLLKLAEQKNLFCGDV